jgi:hypothetical protein
MRILLPVLAGRSMRDVKQIVAKAPADRAAKADKSGKRDPG